MNRKEIVDNTILYVRTVLHEAEGGHDWWHCYRVLQTTRKIAAMEGGDLFVCEIAALLHDLCDPKFVYDDSIQETEDFLKEESVDPGTIKKIMEVINEVSFSQSIDGIGPGSFESKVVQDADRLDALGAIGIARAFNYGGFRNRKIYDPAIKPGSYKSAEEYRSSEAPSVNHFYEKLFLLKDKMNTATGRLMAQERHRFMEMYMEQFFREWNMEV